MKKSILATIALTVGLAFTSVSLPQDVSANTKAKEKTYFTCKELNKVYPNGVSKAKGLKNKVTNKKTGKTTSKVSKAYVSASLYKLNAKRDNDKDGIACEK